MSHYHFEQNILTAIPSAEMYYCTVALLIMSVSILSIELISLVKFKGDI